MEDKNSLANYIKTITGHRDSFQVEGEVAASLPRYIAGLYELRRASVLGVPVIIATLKPTAKPSAVELSRHYDLLKDRANSDIVFVGEAITKRTAERLIRRRIPHIVVGRQLYLPFLFLDIKSTGYAFDDVETPEPGRLSQWSEALVIRQLLHRDLEGKSGADVARATGMSPMTTQRALSQITAAKLCRLEEHGRRKILRFDDSSTLWSEAAKILVAPLSMTLMLKTLPNGVPTFIAGTSALAKATLLAEDEVPIIAASRRLYIRAAEARSVPVEDAKYRLELWDRDPALTAEGGVADPISLYLNMRHGDDRVRIALVELLQKYDLGAPA